jgi:hypothetical protein
MVVPFPGWLAVVSWPPCAGQVGRYRQADAAAGGLGRLPAAPERVEDVR